MGAAGFALFDEVDQAHSWIGLALDKFRRTMDALGPDGASHEGAGYWEYGAEYMLKFMSLADTLLGIDLLTPESVKTDAANLPARGSHGRGANLFTMRFAKHDSRWQNVIALSWAPAGAEVKRVSLARDQRTWTFSVGGKKLVFDWEKGQATLQP